MSHSVKAEPEVGQAQGHDRPFERRSRACDLFREHLKAAMEKTGWTVDALASHFDIDRSYVVRMLGGEKPITSDRLAELPSDLAATFDAIRAERHGLIVVSPQVGLEAQKAFVAGLIGLMSQPAPSQLPEKANAMIHMDTAADQKQKRA